MIRAVIERLPLTFLFAVSCTLCACGGSTVEHKVTSTYWHAAARHVEARHLPARSHPDLVSIALPEVRWTGLRPEPTSAGRIAVGIYADGDVSFGATRLSIDAEGAEEGFRELRARWTAEQGVLSRLFAGDGTPRVEVYADRAASWERVRSVLLFLAMPPHGLFDVWFVVAGNDPVETPLHVPARVGRVRWTDGVFACPDGPRGWESMLAELPILPSDDDPDQHDYVWRGRWGGRFFAGGGWEGEPPTLDLDGTVVTNPARLEDEEVVARANEAWSRWAAGTVWTLRRFRGMYVSVWSGDGEEKGDFPRVPGLAPVPAAYPLQGVDFAHVDGLAVRIELVPSVFLSLEPPPELARPPASPVLPIGVAVGCALVAVFAGRAPRRRRRRDQPTDA